MERRRRLNQMAKAAGTGTAGNVVEVIPNPVHAVEHIEMRAVVRRAEAELQS